MASDQEGKVIMRKKLSPYEYVINRLAARDYSEHQLRAKMKEKQHPQDEIEEAISRAKEQGYLSDERFVKSYVRQKVEVQHWGKQKIRMGLIQAGVASHLMDEALQEVDWQEGWLEAYYKKYGLTQPEDHKERQRRIGYIARRGFAPRLPDSETLMTWAEEQGLTS